MKRYFWLFIVLLLLVLLVLPVFADNSSTLVYVTDTGTKYHRDGCSYLKSQYEITLQNAVGRGYTPCSRCKPPTLDASDTVPATIPPRSLPAETTATARAAVSDSDSRFYRSEPSYLLCIGGLCVALFARSRKR